MHASYAHCRLEIDTDNYKSLETTKDVALLASTLKLFFRELPEPLISREVRDSLLTVATSKGKNVAACRSVIQKDLRGLSLKVLKFILEHLYRVSREPNNMMDAKNLATVFSPNLVHTASGVKRPESMISEMEHNNAIVRTLIEQVNEIFGH